MAKNVRNFKVRYANWSPIDVKVPEDKLVGRDGLGIVRVAIGHAWEDRLGGEWKDGPDIQVVLDKDNPGVWVGQRLHPQTGKKPEPFYVMEV